MRRAIQAAGSALRKTGSADPTICSSCLRNIQRRHAATAAAAASTHSTEPTPELFDQPSPATITSTAPHQAHHIRAGVVLSRPPLITRDLNPFEKSFYLYQRRLNERLALNFTRFFYFPPDTQQERDWKRKIKERVTPARDIGDYQAHSKNGWNDELLVGAPESEPEHQWQRLIEDAAIEVEEEGQVDDGSEKKLIRKEIEKPQPRITEADRTKDAQRLDRSLQRTLYLLVKTKDGKWEFPSDLPAGKESLHRAAERVLVEGAGPNMNTWVVARHPVGWHKNTFEKAEQEKDTKLERLGEKTFFIKGRIMAGQADIKGNKLGFADFKWLSKDEIEQQVEAPYWRSIRNMLVDL